MLPVTSFGAVTLANETVAGEATTEFTTTGAGFAGAGVGLATTDAGTAVVAAKGFSAAFTGTGALATT